MQKTNSNLNAENGSIILVALIVLALLTIIGLSSSQTSIMESRIATNELLHNIAFYKADGGAETGMVLIEHGIEFRGWSDDVGYGEAQISKGDFILNSEDNTMDPVPTDTNRDVYIPNNYTAGEAHTNIKVLNNATLSTGSAAMIASGYEGKGKGGGVWLMYDVRSQHLGTRRTEAKIYQLWRHVF